MADFADLFPDTKLMQLLGDEVTYQPKGGGSTAIKAVVDYGVRNTFATDAYVPERQTSVQVRKADAPLLAKGDRFVHNNNSLLVDAIVDDDGHFVRVLVRNG